MSNNSSTTQEANGFCGGIQALFQKAQEMCNSDQVISSAEQLEKLEQKVCDLADQLQAIIIEERLQSSLDSEEVRETVVPTKKCRFENTHLFCFVNP